MNELSSLPWFGILVTLGIFEIALRLNRRWRTPLLNPVFVTITCIIVLLLGAGIDHTAYEVGGRWLSFLLHPAVVALAIPLVRQIHKVRENLVAVLASVTVGSVIGIVSATVLALLLGGDHQLAATISPKSVTTPIAMGIAEQVGGIPSLTAAIVIITGIVGAMLGPEVIRLIGLRNPMAIGLAVGAAAHGIGTARVLADVPEPAGAMSSIAMPLNGLITAIILPWILPLILTWFAS